MAINLAACVTAFLVSFIILPVIIKYFIQKNLVDVPGRRKIHKKVTPSMGGVAIFGGFMVASLIWMDFDQWQSIRFVLASLFIVFLIGVRDDIVPFLALHKLFGQIIAIVILSFSDIFITSFYGLFGIDEIPTAISYLITGFTIVVITNAFNLIDGLDGLAGSVAVVVLTALGIWFYLANDFVFALLSFSMLGGILAFLVFNWEPSEIFMGDTGAMVIGMLLAVLVIHFMSVNEGLLPNSPIKFSGTVAAAVSFIIIPLSDTLRIFILRVSKGQSPFTPDKSHIHHAIMRLGVTHSKTALILASVQALFIVAIFLFREWSEGYVLSGVIILAMLLSFILDRLILNKLSTKVSD